MRLLKITLALYRDSAVDAFKGLGRSVWAVIALMLAYVGLLAMGLLTAPLGLVGGFVMGFFLAGVVGWYLSLVEVGVNGVRHVRASDLWDHVGRLFYEVIAVLFIFWIANLLLMGTPAHIQYAVSIVATLLFNPVPEMVYQERTQGLGMLGDALSFMQHNWPEWLGAQLLGGAFLALWGLLVHGAMGTALALNLIQSFGPYFGFIMTGAYALQGLDPRGFVGAVALLAFTHWFLLFRGHLYRRLAGSSRRARAWRARM